MYKTNQWSAGVLGVLALATGLALFFAFSRPAQAGTTYAQVQVSAGTVDIWQDTSTGVLTFQWHGAPDSLRFDPSTSTTTQIDGTTVMAVNTYTSSSIAWSNVDSEYGVTQSQVTNALASGTASSPPPAASADVSTQDVTTSPYNTATQYGSNLAGLAAATGLAIPSLSSLDGQAFSGSGVMEGYGPDLASDESTGTYTGSGDTGKVAALWFGSLDSSGTIPIAVNIAAASSTNPTADGSIYQSMYNNSSAYPHLYAPTGLTKLSPQTATTCYPPSTSNSSTSSCPTLADYGSFVEYAQTDEFDIIFQYGSEWVGVTTQIAPTPTEWTSIIQSIITGNG